MSLNAGWSRSGSSFLACRATSCTDSEESSGHGHTASTWSNVWHHPNSASPSGLKTSVEIHRVCHIDHKRIATSAGKLGLSPQRSIRSWGVCSADSDPQHQHFFEKHHNSHSEMRIQIPTFFLVAAAALIFTPILAVKIGDKGVSR